MRQTLEGSSSAVSKRKFATKYALESSRRDLHNALLCTAPKSHFLEKIQLRTFEQVDVPDARRGREELLVPGEDPEGRVLGGPHGERPDFRPGDAWFFICFFVDKLRVEE